MAGQAVEGIADASVRAPAKLGRVLPERWRDRFGTRNASIVPLPRGAGADAVDEPGVLGELARLCRDGGPLRFTCRDHHGAASRRTAEPHRLGCSDRRRNLVAWDTDREDRRSSPPRVRPHLVRAPRGRLLPAHREPQHRPLGAGTAADPSLHLDE